MTVYLSNSSIEGLAKRKKYLEGRITIIACEPWAKMDWVLLAYSYMVMGR